MVHIHLDPVGGVAGDMFVAALLDMRPDLSDLVLGCIRKAGLGEDVHLQVAGFNDGILTGTKFGVTKGGKAAEDAAHHHHDHGHHHHYHWSTLRAGLQASALPDGVKTHALGIFGELALAEARVHGKDVDTVAFHEVGNWDSIADIVGAAALIDALAPKSWSIGSLPIGRGRVKTAHGELAVPAPATTLLLEGLAFHDDGRSGERVTPTGAAILRYLSPSNGIGTAPRTLGASGFGFGTRKLEGMSNTLRVLAFDLTHDAATEDRVGVIQFEIDDQTGEDLAVAIAHLRDHPGVVDVTQSMVVGKKGRMMTALQVLTRSELLDDVAEACFRQTTTIGLRTRIEARRILSRSAQVTKSGTAVKVADRPGGATAKTEADAVKQDASSHKSRQRTRRGAEDEILKE